MWEQLRTDASGAVARGGATPASKPLPTRRSQRLPGARNAGTAAAPGRSARSSSGPATGWSATSRWSWASPARRRTRSSSSCRASPACLPARSAWLPASTSPSSRSARCSSARSRWSERSSPRSPRRRRRSSSGSTYRRDPGAGRAAHRRQDLRGSRDRPRDDGPRGARPRPEAARLAVVGRRRILRRLLPGCDRAGHPVPLRRRHADLHDQLRREPRGPVRRGGAGQPADRPQPLFSGFRQVGLGAAAAILTYFVGA